MCGAKMTLLVSSARLQSVVVLSPVKTMQSLRWRFLPWKTNRLYCDSTLEISSIGCTDSTLVPCAQLFGEMCLLHIYLF